MCGICGVVYSDHTRTMDEQALTAMRDALAHRGPDDRGSYCAPGVALGSRRLAILDLSANGHMPMVSEDGRYHIVYNGEVYNYRELRPGLEARGYRFRSNTDTEVLLNLFIEEGPAMLARLNGMFALAVWDTRRRELFVARDRLGVKPLYYAQTEDALLFASEEKALFAAGVEARFDAAAWPELLQFRYTAGERTPFVGVQRLLPGHYFTWRDGRMQIRRWWNLSERARVLQESAPRDSTAWFRQTFDAAVNLRRISDVPVGVLLSGGLDSGSVAASLAEQSETRVSSFTVRFDAPGRDEGELAQAVAQQHQLDFHDWRLPAEDLIAQLEEAAWFNDEPLAHGNDLYLLGIARYAKPKVTVLLSGEGADETLGGYVRYRPLQYAPLLRAGRLAAGALQQLPAYRWRKLGRFLALASTQAFVLFNACDLLPSELDLFARPMEPDLSYRASVLAEARALYPREPMRQAMYLDQHTFLTSLLDRNDRMTMGASIECRVPFLDYRLVEGLAVLPTSQLLSRRQSKVVLRRALGHRLPDAVLHGRKWGFGVPWHHYFRALPELTEMVRRLPEAEAVRAGEFIPAKLRAALDAFLAGDNSREPLIRQLLMVSIWHRAYFARLRTQQVVMA